MTTYFKDGARYLAVTDESPKGFKNTLFVGRGGPINSITEQLFAKNQIEGFEPVSLSDVPVEWVTAIGYDTVEEFPVFDLSGTELLDLPQIRIPSRPAADPRVFQLGLALGTIIAIAWYLLFSW